MQMYLGIDPGAGGGLALLTDIGAIVSADPMPRTHQDLLDRLTQISETYAESPPRAFLEKVAATPQMGVVSVFTFGTHYGALRMALLAAGIPVEEVSPIVWQRAMHCLIPGKHRDPGPLAGKKNLHKAKAQALFPQIKITHAIADALLIAEYGRRLETRYDPGSHVASRPSPTTRPGGGTGGPGRNPGG